MKSVTIKTDKGKLLIRVRRQGNSVVAYSLSDLAPLVITCVMDDNKRIKVYTGRE